MPFLATHSGRSTPAGFEEHPCCHCGDPILVNAHTSETPTCPACRRALIEGEMSRILGDVRDVVKGRGEFEFASPVERQRFLRRLRELVLKNIMPLPVNACCEETTAEPVYVWDGEAPDPATRKELEDRLEALAEEEALAAIEA